MTTEESLRAEIAALRETLADRKVLLSSVLDSVEEQAKDISRLQELLDSVNHEVIG